MAEDSEQSKLLCSSEIRSDESQMRVRVRVRAHQLLSATDTGGKFRELPRPSLLSVGEALWMFSTCSL